MFLQSPERHFKDELELTARCMRCKTPFVVKDGFGYEGWNRQGDGHFLWQAVVVCTPLCRLMICQPIHGTGEA